MTVAAALAVGARMTLLLPNVVALAIPSGGGVRTHEPAAVVAVDGSGAAPHHVGAAVADCASHHRPLLQRGVSKLEVAVASVERRLGCRWHRLRHRLPSEQQSRRFRVYANDIRCQRHLLS